MVTRGLFFLGFLTVAILTSSCQTEKPSDVHVAAGRIHTIDTLKTQYLGNRRIDVWTPSSYDGVTRYPVIYMHDGNMLFDSTTTWNHQEWGVDEALTALERKTGKSAIVVGIWNAESLRSFEYMPQKAFEEMSEADDSLFLATWPSEIRNTFLKNKRPLYADDYLEFIVQQVKPFVDSQFSTLSDRQHTFLMGSSYGGLISWYGVCEYPETFGGAACLSTHWTGSYTNDRNPLPDAFVSYLHNHIPEPGHHRFYFDHGDQTLDSLYGVHQKRIDSLFINKGYTSPYFISKLYPGTNHSEEAWAERLESIMHWLIP